MRAYTNSSLSEKKKSKTATFRFTYKEFAIALFIIVVATFPYLHDIIPLSEDENFHGFSTMRVFVYMFLFHIYAHIGWLAAFFLAKGKSFRFAFLVPVVLSAYQVFLILFDLRSTELNSINLKFILFIVLSLFVVIHYFKNMKNERT